MWSHSPFSIHPALVQTIHLLGKEHKEFTPQQAQGSFQNEKHEHKNHKTLIFTSDDSSFMQMCNYFVIKAPFERQNWHPGEQPQHRARRGTEPQQLLMEREEGEKGGKPSGTKHPWLPEGSSAEPVE